jgi:hypothetical protein
MNLIIIGYIQMKKPKKLAAVLEFDKPELEYLLRCMLAEAKFYVRSGSRDFYAEELFERVKKKLEVAAGSF